LCNTNEFEWIGCDAKYSLDEVPGRNRGCPPADRKGESGDVDGGSGMSWKEYPEYKPTGMALVKSVPSHWKILKLKYLSRTQFSNVDKNSNKDEVQVRLCRNAGGVPGSLGSVQEPVFLFVASDSVSGLGP
jgi:hypothetical protein